MKQREYWIGMTDEERAAHRPGRGMFKNEPWEGQGAAWNRHSLAEIERFTELARTWPLRRLAEHFKITPAEVEAIARRRFIKLKS